MPKKIMDSEKLPVRKSKSITVPGTKGQLALHDVKQYLQDSALQMRLILELERIALGGKVESDRIKAANSLLDRCLGKPETVHQINAHHDQTVVVIRDTGLEPLDITAEVERLANDKPKVLSSAVDCKNSDNNKLERMAIDAIATDILSDVLDDNDINELLGDVR